jgi:hypothetical protein
MLAEGIEVKGASLDNGLLHIELERPTQEIKVRSVAIKTGASARKQTQTIDVNAERNGKQE